MDGGQEQQADSTKGRCLRRTVSVPSEGQFPEYPPEGATKLGKLLCIRKEMSNFYPVIYGLVIESVTIKENILDLVLSKYFKIQSEVIRKFYSL